MAQGQKKFSKNPAAKKKKAAKPATKAGRGRHIAPKKAAAIKATKVKRSLERAIHQNIEEEIVKQAVANAQQMRVVSTTPAKEVAKASRPKRK